MDTDAETNTLTILGAVDPVAVVLALKKARLAAAIVRVEDDNPPEPAAETSEEEPAACQCHEAATACVPGCYYRPSALPDCCYYRGAFRAAPYGYGYVCCDERPVMGGGVRHPVARPRVLPF